MFVSYNEKQVHAWNEFTGQQQLKVNFYEETKSHAISCMCYSQERQLYFIISTDFKLYIFNENLIMAASVAIKAGLINQCTYYDRESLLLTVGVEGCNLLQLSIK